MPGSRYSPCCGKSTDPYSAGHPITCRCCNRRPKNKGPRERSAQVRRCACLIPALAANAQLPKISIDLLTYPASCKFAKAHHHPARLCLRTDLYCQIQAPTSAASSIVNCMPLCTMAHVLASTCRPWNIINHSDSGGLAAFSAGNRGTRGSTEPCTKT